jgi:trehalose-6-phosphate synthase
MTDSKRKNIINAIYSRLEDDDLNDWESHFIEDIANRLGKGSDLTTKQKEKLIDIIGTEWV